MGFLYRPKLRGGGHSRIWWCKYYVNGGRSARAPAIATTSSALPTSRTWPAGLRARLRARRTPPRLTPVA